MTVYVTQASSKHNLAKALRFGTLVPLTPEHTNLMLASQPVVRHLRQQLRGFTDLDHLLPLGSPAVIGAAIALAAQANHGRVKVLQWDRGINDYYEVSLDLLDRVRELEP